LKISSFLSEHSVEYCLVVQVHHIFSPQYLITPLFFWSSREGSNISLACEQGVRLKCFAVYARRPKLCSPVSDQINIKINDHIIKRAEYLNSVGIPVLCAVPHCRSILDYNITNICSWFSIESTTDYHQDIEISLDYDSGIVNRSTNRQVALLVEKDEICDMINTKAGAMTLSDAIGLIKVRIDDSRRFPFWGGEYKPIYFLLKEGVNDGKSSQI
jgi:hypothetical protein